MKKDKDKSKKSHESTIGKIIYGFLLFLPLFAIGTTCLISTFNMSGKKEAEIHYKYETNEVNSNDDLIVGRIYHFTFNFDNLTFTNLFECGNIYNIQGNADSSLESESTNKFRGYATSTTTMGIYAVTSISNTGVLSVNNLDTHIFECDLIYSRITYLDNWENYSISTYNVIESIETHNLNAEEVFYNSIDKVQQSPLFNWTTNSLLYTGMNEFTTSLSITTPFIPLLLTYWLIISVVYFLYDIVLVILTVLHRKIHNLQDSI